MKIIDKQNRAALGEGRTTGIGFAFAKKVKDDLELVQPISPCKDYLNDVVYAEHLKTSVKACGLNYDHQDLFDEKISYLVGKICKSNRSIGTYTGGRVFEDDIKLLNGNIKNIQKFLNWIENKLELGETQIELAPDNHVVFILPYYWSSSTYLISLYTLLIRMSMTYDGSEPAEWLNNFAKPMEGKSGLSLQNETMEVMLWGQAKSKLMLLMSGHKIKQTFDINTGGAIHNMGISYFNDFKF